MNKSTTIRVSPETKTKLEENGIKGETFDDIIMKMVFQARKDLGKIERNRFHSFYDAMIRVKFLKMYYIYCQRCDIKRADEIHHKDGKRNNNDLSNLELLCHICHQRKYNKAGNRIPK